MRRLRVTAKFSTLTWYQTFANSSGNVDGRECVHWSAGSPEQWECERRSDGCNHIKNKAHGTHLRARDELKEPGRQDQDIDLANDGGGDW